MQHDKSLIFRSIFHIFVFGSESAGVIWMCQMKRWWVLYCINITMSGIWFSSMCRRKAKKKNVKTSEWLVRLFLRPFHFIIHYFYQKHQCWQMKIILCIGLPCSVWCSTNTSKHRVEKKKNYVNAKYWVTTQHDTTYYGEKGKKKKNEKVNMIWKEIFFLLFSSSIYGTMVLR